MTHDDEIVFEGSLLDKYLKGVVTDDYLTVSRDHQLDIVDCGKVEDCCRESGERDSWRLRRWLIERCNWLFDNCTVSKIDINGMIWNMTHSVYLSDLLDVDDTHFLHSVDPQCFDRPTGHKNARHARVFPVDVVAFCGLICAFSSQLILAFSDVVVTRHVMLLLVVVLLMGLAMVSLLAFEFYLWWICWQWHHHIMCVEELVSTINSCFDIFSKSIKLIKEQEVIANGFVCSQALFEAPNVKDNRGCPALRVTMANEGLLFLIGLREATCQLVHRVPVSTYIDDSSHYIAFVELETLSVSEQPSHLPKPLSELKILLQLIRSQTSEYFRRLILCFTKLNISSPQKLRRTNEQLRPSITRLQQLSTHWKHTISETLEFQKRLLIEDCHTSVVSNMLKSHVKYTSRQMSLLHVANNMEVHLQAALLRVRELVRHIDSDGHISSSNAVEAIGEWLESDVSSCSSSCCLLLTNLRSLLHPELEDMNNTHNSQTADSEDEGQDDFHVACGKNAMDQQQEIDDEDKVYEAYVPPEEEDHKQSSFRSSKQDHQLSNGPHDSQDPLKMIIELKSVLAAKATSKLKSESVRDTSEPSSHVIKNADCSDRNDRSSKEKMNMEVLRNCIPFGVDMSSLSTTIAAVRKRNVGKTDELEASGEAELISTDT